MKDNTIHIQVLLCQYYKDILSKIERKEIVTYDEVIEYLAMSFFFPTDKEIDKLIKDEKKPLLIFLEKMLDFEIIKINNNNILDVDYDKINKYEKELRNRIHKTISSKNNCYETQLLVRRKKTLAKNLLKQLIKYDILKIDSMKQITVSKGFHNAKNICKENQQKILDDFITNLCPISDTDIDAINEILEIYKGENKKFKPLTRESLQKIKYYAFIINNLRINGITSKNYHTKLQSYLKQVDKMREQYGILIEKPFPFSNPNLLYAEIDKLLLSHNLNSKQKHEFYKALNLKNRTPNASLTKSYLQPDEIYNDFNKLTEKEQNSIVEREYANFSGRVKKLIKKYGYKIPIKKDSEDKITDWKIYTEDDLPQKLCRMNITAFSIFLNYIDYLYSAEPPKGQLKYEEIKKKHQDASVELSFFNHHNLINNLPNLLYSPSLFK